MRGARKGGQGWGSGSSKSPEWWWILLMIWERVVDGTSEQETAIKGAGEL